MSQRILLLEDDENYQKLLASILREEGGYEVLAADSTAKAVELAGDVSFDLMLADVRVKDSKPGVPESRDGVNAAAEVRKLQPHIYCIILTGYADEDAVARAMNQGVDYYLFKPVPLAKLLNVVESVLLTREEHSTYQHKLGQWFKNSRRALGELIGRIEGSSEPSLDQARIRFHRAFYIGMQTGNLTVNGALCLWSALIPLESKYLQLKQIIGPETAQLTSDYSNLQIKAEAYARTRSLGESLERVPMQHFSPLYRRVSDHQVAFPDYMAAPEIWLAYHHSPQSNKPADLAKAAQQLFSPL